MSKAKKPTNFIIGFLLSVLLWCAVISPVFQEFPLDSYQTHANSFSSSKLLTESHFHTELAKATVLSEKQSHYLLRLIKRHNSPARRIAHISVWGLLLFYAFLKSQYYLNSWFFIPTSLRFIIDYIHHKDGEKVLFA